jgi:NAD+ synthetase
MGRITVRGPLFEESLLTADLDPDAVTHARADAPLLGDLETELPHLVRGLEAARAGAASREPPREGRDYDAATEPRALRPPRPTPAVPMVGLGYEPEDPLHLDCELTRQWLVAFLRDEVVRRRGFTTALVGVSGGVDSSLTAHLAVEALGKDNVIAVRMPYRTSSPESLAHAQLVIDKLGVQSLTVDISDAVDGYARQVDEMDSTRRGNVMARTRMIVLFDLSAKHRALPLGTGNKSERLLGYFTWHADDTPPVNPLGDLFKTQVWTLARHVGVPEVILAKPATPDLVPGQRTEHDYGFTYAQADPILHLLVRGYTVEQIVARGHAPDVVAAVRQRLESTHWKRKLPTVAVMSQTAIGEYYLRPVDY